MDRFWKNEDAKIFQIKCNKYRRFKNPNISYIFDKTLVLSIICDRCGKKVEKIFKEEDIETLKILAIINMNE